MPITKAKYRCLYCEDTIEATSLEFSKCKCSKSEIKPSWTGYSYKENTKVERIESNTYYLEEEFVKIPQDIQIIYDEIKKIKNNTGYKYYLYEMTDRGENDERYLSTISCSYSESVDRYTSEVNEVQLRISLRKEDYEGDETVKLRMSKFLEIMKLIESGEFKLSNRKNMIEYADNENVYYRRESTEEYNYKFYF